MATTTKKRKNPVPPLKGITRAMVGSLARKSNPQKPLSELTASQLETAIARADSAHSALLDEMIAAGRGHERPTETAKKDDDLSRRFNASMTRNFELSHELRSRLEYHGKKSPVRRKNPVPSKRNPSQTDIQRAGELYRQFTGHEPGPIGRVKVPDLPKAVAVIGTVDFLGYTTDREGRIERYKHTFRKKDQPLFCVAPDGTQLLLVGGAYDFTERGIIDRSDTKNRAK